MKKNEFLRSLKILHLAIVVGLFIFIGVIYLLIHLGVNEAKILDFGDYNIYVFILGGVFLLMANAVGKGVIIQKVDALPNYADATDRLKAYREGYIFSLILIEFPSILLCIFGMMMEERNLLLMAVMGGVLLLLKRPKWEHVKEYSKLENKDVIDFEKE